MVSYFHQARLAQSVEHETLNLRVVGSSPTLGDQLFSRKYSRVSQLRIDAKSLFLNMCTKIRLLAHVCLAQLSLT